MKGNNKKELNPVTEFVITLGIAHVVMYTISVTILIVYNLMK